ncbi:hypothetical protein PR002_g17915 [Phytophthora rubi]|uniref:Uncharacterized protein n=1 Tax=Phytophthora rubi TaxID=129364 RepID=A0A6A3K1G7_9STRA|nr:hypothetical protein PR002_g17915 [Phytophthora rubi]
MLSVSPSTTVATALAAAALFTSACLHKFRDSDSRSSASAMRCLASWRKRSLGA